MSLVICPRTSTAHYVFRRPEESAPQPVEPQPKPKKVPRRLARQRFLRSPAWLAARAECLRRQGEVCNECGATERIQVDHILPRYRYPELALDQRNLRPLCWPCNRGKAAKVLPELAARFGLSQFVDKPYQHKEYSPC